MLPYDQWLDSAETLGEGRTRRINHLCGPGRTLIISHDSKGYSAFCFRCNEGGRKAHGIRTLDQLAAAKEARSYANQHSTTLRLPRDYTQDIPRSGRLWYWRSGCTDRCAELYGIGWSESQQRVVLPVYGPCGKRLDFVQSRAVRRGDQPKYLNTRAAGRAGCAFFSDPRTIGYYGAVAEDRPGSRIVVCEDILSSIRVGMSIQSCSILGTKLDAELASRLKSWPRVTFWLDGDKAGIKGRVQAMRTLSLLHPGTVDYIESPRDPKSYSQEEIRQWLMT